MRKMHTSNQDNIGIGPASSYATVFPSGSILVDGTNLAYVEGDHNRSSPRQPKLKWIFKVLQELYSLGFTRTQIRVYFEANTQFRLTQRDCSRLAKEIHKGRIILIPPHTACDNVFLLTAKRLNCQFIIISNDRFSRMTKWFGQHRIGVGFRQTKGTFLCINTPQDLQVAYFGSTCPSTQTTAANSLGTLSLKLDDVGQLNGQFSGTDQAKILIQTAHGTKLLTTLSQAQLKIVLSLAPFDLSPRKLQELLPDLTQDRALLLLEALLCQHRTASDLFLGVGGSNGE